MSDGIPSPTDGPPILQAGNRDMNYFLSMIGFLTAAALPVVMAFLGGEWVSRQGAIGAYIGTLVTLFALFLLLIAAGVWLKKRALPPLAGLPAAYVTLVVPVTCLLMMMTVTYQFPPMGYGMGILIAHLGFLILWRFGRARISGSVFLASMNKIIILLLPLFYGGIFWGWFIQRYKPFLGRGAIVLLAAMIAGFAVFTQSDRFRPLRRRWSSQGWIVLLLGLLLCGLVYQPELPHLRSHYNTLLATMQDVLSGKFIFVDTLSQYGVGIVYFLLAVFNLFRLPVAYPGLAIVLNVLYILQFALLFLILHQATKNIFISLAGLAGILYFAYFAVSWPSMLRVPAQSPLRYGMTYLLLGVGWAGMNRTGRVWRIAELVLLGAASVWSLEVLFFTVIPLDALLFTGGVLFSDKPRTGLREFGNRFLLQIGVIGFCWIAWWVATAIAAGQPPNLSYYFEVFLKYTSSERYGPQMDFHSFWNGVVPAIYLGTLLAVVFTSWRQRSRLPGEIAAVMAGFSVAGLLQYLYYFVYDLDYHLSLICTPAILVIVLWIFISQKDRTARGVPRLNRWIFGLTVIISVWFCMVLTSGFFNIGIKNSLIYKINRDWFLEESLVFTNPYRLQPSNDTVVTLAAFVQKYAAGDPSIAIFAKPEDQTEVLLLTHKTHLLDLTDPLISTSSRSFTSHILSLAGRYAGVPEYIFYDSSENALIETQWKAFQLLAAGASYSVVDRKGSILVYRKQ
ncbi:MAG: hypothetical protein JW748_03895 [Anaerolineales bacterium]|nr:hypothetical protein [Anaerolineales bacterium]